MTKTFAPSIRLKNGAFYEPRGWEWILAFAINGCDWAIQKASQPGFRENIIEDLKETKRQELQEQIDEYLCRIKRLGKELRILEQ